MREPIERTPNSWPQTRRTAQKRVRITKKVRVAGGVWKFISLDRVGDRYVWDKRPGYYFLEWWEGRKRRREKAGTSPSEALDAQRRKRNELVGELVADGRAFRREFNLNGSVGSVFGASAGFTYDFGTNSILDFSLGGNVGYSPSPFRVDFSVAPGGTTHGNFDNVPWFLSGSATGFSGTGAKFNWNTGGWTSSQTLGVPSVSVGAGYRWRFGP